MEYSNSITLIKNKRGCYDLDTTKGCAHGVANSPGGCYGECYAFRSATRYGIDFSKTVLRDFDNYEHRLNIIRQIAKVDMPFIRIGVTGDPSDNWEHTLNVYRMVSVDTQLSLFPELKSRKRLVISTKHWHNLADDQLSLIGDLCVNTSVSALDNKRLLNNRIAQYNRLKNYCKSVLRIVSCDFNLKNRIGRKLDKIQRALFDNENTLDTVLRVSANNKYATSGIINTETKLFLGKLSIISMFNKSTYFGACSTCPEMCGINM